MYNIIFTANVKQKTFLPPLLSRQSLSNLSPVFRP